ncbi:MAG: AmmeMemoRadiSam system protein B [Candidatus Brocadiaceae bacterium]|jgi:AmmeMemoRadiSam system protein B
MSRKPVVAGQFYPGEADALRSAIDSFTPEEEEQEPALGLLSPHAGYTFCGEVAGRTFARVRMPETVVLLNPSHSFASPAFALWPEGDWQTPLGRVELHEELTDGLSGLSMVTTDARPHGPEHSGEVVLPFLQYHRADLRIAVVCITAAARLDALKEFGRSLAELLETCGEDDALVVASSDMSHESGASALEVVNRNDPVAVREMEKLDPDGLYKVCRQEGITMCGVLPATAMMASVIARGGEEGVLVARATSADSPMGRGSYVVGYAGMIFR